MSTNKALIAIDFSFFSSHPYGDETQKELRSDNQAFILEDQHSF